MSEIWKDVVGYEGKYQVSSLGRVRSLPRVVKHPTGVCKLKGRILKNFYSDFGYSQVGLEGKTVNVHKLVADAFLGPRGVGVEVRHGANGIDDNSVDNLSYGTRQQNALDQRRDGTHGGTAVRRSDGQVFINVSVAAEQSGTHHGNIVRVCQGKRKSAGGYGWKYE